MTFRHRCRPSMIAATVLTAAFAVLPPTAVRAAGAHAGGGQRLRAALAQLDLSARQKQQVERILSEAKASRPAPAASQGATRKPHAGAGRAVLGKVLAVLTPAQQAKLKQLMQSARPGAVRRA